MLLCAVCTLFVLFSLLHEVKRVCTCGACLKIFDLVDWTEHLCVRLSREVSLWSLAG